MVSELARERMWWAWCLLVLAGLPQLPWGAQPLVIAARCWHLWRDSMRGSTSMRLWRMALESLDWLLVLGAWELVRALVHEYRQWSVELERVVWWEAQAVPEWTESLEGAVFVRWLQSLGALVVCCVLVLVNLRLLSPVSCGGAESPGPCMVGLALTLVFSGVSMRRHWLRQGVEQHAFVAVARIAWASAGLFWIPACVASAWWSSRPWFVSLVAPKLAPRSPAGTSPDGANSATAASDKELGAVMAKLARWSARMRDESPDWTDDVRASLLSDGGLGPPCVCDTWSDGECCQGWMFFCAGVAARSRGRRAFECVATWPTTSDASRVPSQHAALIREVCFYLFMREDSEYALSQSAVVFCATGRPLYALLPEGRRRPRDKFSTQTYQRIELAAVGDAGDSPTWIDRYLAQDHARVAAELAQYDARRLAHPFLHACRRRLLAACDVLCPLLFVASASYLSLVQPAGLPAAVA